MLLISAIKINQLDESIQEDSAPVLKFSTPRSRTISAMPEIEVLQPSSPVLQPAPSMKMSSGTSSSHSSNITTSKPVLELDQPPPLFADDEKKSSKIQELRKLIENYDDFVRRSDDLFLVRFLHCCDWNVDAAYQRMIKLFKLKHDHPDWFVDKPLRHYEGILKRNIKFALDKRDKNGRRIFVSKMGNMDINAYSATDLAHLDELWFELMLNELDTQKNGISCLIDMRGYSIRSMRYLTPTNIRIATQKADLMPLKHMEFHVVNSSAFMNAAVAILYPMLSKQIKDSVHFHYSNWDSLHAQLGKDALPAEYGGTNGETFDYDMLNRQLLDLEPHYDSLVRFGYELKPHVDPSRYAKFFHNVEKIKGNKRKYKSKKTDDVEE